MTTQTVIIGGGLIGVSTLYELVARGHPALLIEADKALAQGASFANGGMVTASMSDPWNGPGVGKHLVASFFDPYAAMKLRLRAAPGLTLWGLRFLYNSLPARHRRATGLCFALANRSAALLRQRIEELALDVDISHAGTLKVFRTPGAMAAAENLAGMLARAGLRYEVLNSEGIAEREPELAGTAGDLEGAIYFPDDSTGDARRFVEQLAQAAKARGGEIRTGTNVSRIDIRDGKVAGIQTDQGPVAADRIVVATGHQAPALARRSGLRLPIRPAKGYSVTVDAANWPSRPKVTVIDDAMHAAVSVIGNRLRFVGTAEFAGADLRLDEARIENLVNLFCGLYPHLAAHLDKAEMEPWTGLRPMSADGIPFIGPAGPGGLWINAGQGHLGWTMSAGSAELLVDLIEGKRPMLDPGPFDPRR